MIIDILFFLRFVPLTIAGFVATRRKDFIGMLISVLYLCVTTVNYLFANPALNAVFSTPLVFLTAWYVIDRNRKTL